jgi:hypothetical protein
MPTRRSSVSETAEWPVPAPRAVALLSPRVVERAVRRLEDALTVLELTPRMGARARGVVRFLGRAD